MDFTTFKRKCDDTKLGRFSSDEAMLGTARSGLYETKLLLEALWECCARLTTTVDSLREANRALDSQNRRLKDEIARLKGA